MFFFNSLTVISALYMKLIHNVHIFAGEESVTHVTPSPVRSASPLNRTKSDTQGKTQEPVRNNNDLENDSTQHKVKLVPLLKTN